MADRGRHTVIMLENISYDILHIGIDSSEMLIICIWGYLVYNQPGF